MIKIEDTQAFENGLCKLANNRRTVHMIHPVPQPKGAVVPWCRQDKGKTEVIPANDAEEANCGSCKRRSKTESKVRG